MSDKQSILLTGINGFIGTVLAQVLRSSGHDVWGIAHSSGQGSQIVKMDLLNLQEVIEKAKDIPPFAILIHTAALAHGQKIASDETTLTINNRMTENVLIVFEERTQHIIFLSSVAVYGEDKRYRSVSVNDDLRPSTDYGKSKMICEDRILASNIEHCDILRLTPVFNKNHMMDIRKRVFLPGLSSYKMILNPSPCYSLVNINTVVQTIMNIIYQKPNGRRIFNVADPIPYDQNNLSSWFPEKGFFLPVSITKPLYWLTFLLPKKLGYAIRCLYWKLFHSNIYDVNTKLILSVNGQ